MTAYTDEEVKNSYKKYKQAGDEKSANALLKELKKRNFYKQDLSKEETQSLPENPAEFYGNLKKEVLPYIGRDWIERQYGRKKALQEGSGEAFLNSGAQEARSLAKGVGNFLGGDFDPISAAEQGAKEVRSDQHPYTSFGGEVTSDIAGGFVIATTAEFMGVETGLVEVASELGIPVKQLSKLATKYGDKFLPKLAKSMGIGAAYSGTQAEGEGAKNVGERAKIGAEGTALLTTLISAVPLIGRHIAKSPIFKKLVSGTLDKKSLTDKELLQKVKDNSEDFPTLSSLDDEEILNLHPLIEAGIEYQKTGKVSDATAKRVAEVVQPSGENIKIAKAMGINPKILSPAQLSKNSDYVATEAGVEPKQSSGGKLQKRRGTADQSIKDLPEKIRERSDGEIESGEVAAEIKAKKEKDIGKLTKVVGEKSDELTKIIKESEPNQPSRLSFTQHIIKTLGEKERKKIKLHPLERALLNRARNTDIVIGLQSKVDALKKKLEHAPNFIRTMRTKAEITKLEQKQKALLGNGLTNKEKQLISDYKEYEGLNKQLETAKSKDLLTDDYVNTELKKLNYQAHKLKNGDPYPKLPDFQKSQLRKLIRKTRYDSLRTNEERKLFNEYNAYTKRYKKLQEDNVELFGNDLADNVIKPLAESLKDAPNENQLLKENEFIKLVEKIPEEYRSRAISSAVYKFLSGSGNEELNPTKYLQWFDRLSKRPRLRKAIYNKIPLEIRAMLRGTASLAKAISEAKKGVSYTGKSIGTVDEYEKLFGEILDARKGWLSKLYSHPLVQKYQHGLAVGAGGIFGGIPGALAAGSVSVVSEKLAIKKQKNLVSLVNNFLGSKQLNTALINYAKNPKAKAAIDNAIQKSPAYKQWFKAMPKVYQDHIKKSGFMSYMMNVLPAKLAQEEPDDNADEFDHE